MDKTAIQTSVPPAPPPQPPAPARPQPAARKGVWDQVKKALTPLASLRLTVVLFALSLVIVFAGTLAEKDSGLHTVLQKYFRCYTVVWVPLDLFTHRWFHTPGSIPFPGGWLIGGALMFNLLAAHLVRFKLSWRRSGIILLHAGIGVLFVGEFIAGIRQVEGRLTVREGEAQDYTEDINSTELAIIDPSDPKADRVVVIPGTILRKGGTITDERLPFDVEVVKYMVNSDYPGEAPKGAANPATAGDGLALVTQERPESSGAEAATDFPSAYVTFRDKQTHESLGTYLASTWLSGEILPKVDLPDMPQRVRLGGKRYDVYLRFKRTYKPYAVYLYKFDHDNYPGTDTPKNFASTVRLSNPEMNEVLDNQKISMNAPLRYRGETFYQSSYLEGGRRGTILQVVRNPGWLLPYVACGMVAAGMLIHFGLGLVKFLERRAAR